MAIATNTTPAELSKLIYSITQGIQALKEASDRFAAFWGALDDPTKQGYGYDAKTLANVNACAAMIPLLSAAMSTPPQGQTVSAIQICQALCPFPDLTLATS